MTLEGLSDQLRFLAWIVGEQSHHPTESKFPAHPDVLALQTENDQQLLASLLPWSPSRVVWLVRLPKKNTLPPSCRFAHAF